MKMINRKTLPILLILALFVMGCADSSEVKQPIDFGTVKVNGVCNDFENTYESNYDIKFYATNDLEKVFVLTMDTSIPDFGGDDYVDKLIERYSNITKNETLDVVMKYETPKVYINEMTQEIFEQNVWRIESVHGYGLNEDDEGNFGYDFYVKGSCKLKVLERETSDGSFLNNKKIIFDSF